MPAVTQNSIHHLEGAVPFVPVSRDVVMIIDEIDKDQIGGDIIEFS